MEEVWQGSKHVPLIYTGMEEHEHLTNHFTKKLNVKIFKMFTELFSNVDLDSIQETYPKINVYNKVIVQYTKETNVKYGLNLKFTKLEALEVGLGQEHFRWLVMRKAHSCLVNSGQNHQNHNHHSIHQCKQMNCHSLYSGLKLTKRPVWPPSDHIAHQ